MIEAVMCCAKCGGALKIVCEAHGTEFVPDRRMLPKEQPKPPRPRAPHTSAIRRGETKARPGSHRERLLAAVSTDPTNPSTPKELAITLERPQHLVAIELANLAKAGRLDRVGQGKYVCAP